MFYVGISPQENTAPLPRFYCHGSLSLRAILSQSEKLEIAGVKVHTDEDGKWCERTREGETPEFYSVYARCKPHESYPGMEDISRAECLADHATRERATAWAEKLKAEYPRLEIKQC